MTLTMTGAGRPRRDDQNSLTAMAARGEGWSYADLLVNVRRQAWGGEDPSGKNKRGGDRAVGG